MVFYFPDSLTGYDRGDGGVVFIELKAQRSRIWEAGPRDHVTLAEAGALLRPIEDAITVSQWFPQNLAVQFEGKSYLSLTEFRAHAATNGKTFAERTGPPVVKEPEPTIGAVRRMVLKGTLQDAKFTAAGWVPYPAKQKRKRNPRGKQ